MPELIRLPIWQNLSIVTVGAVVVWIAGTRLSNYADQIAKRTRLTNALAGLLLLGLATSLPEVATTLTASLGGNAELATSNLLGGVAMQTTVLAVVDFIVIRGALTYFTPKPVLLMQAVVLIVLLAIVIAASASGDGWVVWSVGVGTIVLAAAYVAGVFITERFERKGAWEAINPPDKPDSGTQRDERYSSMSARRIYLSFALASAVVLVAGWAVTEASDAIADRTGISATFIGATLLAVTTSMPELSTTIQAARLGRYGMAVANIFGSNCLDTAMLFLADVGYRTGPILSTTTRAATFAAALGILLTCVYLWGLLEREQRSVARVGWDSAAAVVIYLLGMGVLFTIR